MSYFQFIKRLKLRISPYTIDKDCNSGFSSPFLSQLCVFLFFHSKLADHENLQPSRKGRNYCPLLWEGQIYLKVSWSACTSVNQCVPNSEAENGCASTSSGKSLWMLSGKLEYNVLVQRKRGLEGTYLQELAFYCSYFFLVHENDD